MEKIHLQILTAIQVHRILILTAAVHPHPQAHHLHPVGESLTVNQIPQIAPLPHHPPPLPPSQRMKGNQSQSAKNDAARREMTEEHCCYD